MTFSRSDVSGTGIFRFSPAQPATLSEGTTYWLTATATDGFRGSLWWNDQNYQTIRQDTIQYTQTDGGGSSTGTYPGPQSAFALSAQSAAAAAPEPGTIALLLTAGAPIVGIVRRHRSLR